MAGYLLDTNVISELIKKRPAPQVAPWLTGHADCYLSVLTLGELERGVCLLRQRDSVRAGRLDDWLSRLASEYADRILNVDARVVSAWANLPFTRTLPVIDSLIAATAAAHDLTVATRNTADFEDTGVLTIDPFL